MLRLFVTGVATVDREKPQKGGENWQSANLLEKEMLKLRLMEKGNRPKVRWFSQRQIKYLNGSGGQMKPDYWLKMNGELC